MATLAAMRTGCRRLDPAAVRAQLCNLHRDRVGRAVGAQLRALQRATAALVAEHLQREVGDASLIGYARPGLHLGTVLTELLEWTLHRMLWQAPAVELAASLPARFAAAALERHAALVHRSLGELLGGLERHLREWLW